MINNYNYVIKKVAIKINLTIPSPEPELEGWGCQTNPGKRVVQTKPEKDEWWVIKNGRGEDQEVPTANNRQNSR